MRRGETGLSIFALLRARMRGQDIHALAAQERARALHKKQRAEHAKTNKRIKIAIFAALFAYSYIGIQMARLALSEPIKLTSTYVPESIYGGRADIVDRKGQVLATNIPGYSLYVRPADMVAPKTAADRLAQIFPKYTADTFYELFTSSEIKFRFIEDQISPEQRSAIMALGEPGLQFGRRELRIFPNSSLAAHVLGRVSMGQAGTNSVEIKGSEGIEYTQNAYLADEEKQHKPRVLSLDLAVQDAIEQVLGRAVSLHKAKGAASVLLDVHTGEVLALSSLPDYDPNRPKTPVPEGRDPSDSPEFNRAVLGLYELGSTFKLFTAAAAMEYGTANPDTMVPIGHALKVGRFNIRDFHYYGESLSLMQVIVKSSNIGTGRLALGLGAEKQQEFLHRLGLDVPTSLELPEAARAQPQLPAKDNWQPSSIVTVSYGHGISVSLLHLAQAYATLVNGGYRIKPTLLHDEANGHGEQVLRPETSLALRRMLRAVVQEGTASLAKTEYYDIGGKTGTAEKLKPTGGYYADKNVNTFVAAFPMSEPKYVLVVMLDDPQNPFGRKDQRTAGWTTAPVTREIVMRIAPLLEIRPIYTPDIPIN